MSSEATPEQVDQSRDVRSVQGFNSLYLMAAVHPGGYGAAEHAPNNREGDPPYATPGDSSTAGTTPESERYRAWIDSIVAKAGCSRATTSAGRRYRDAPNVIWFGLGDFAPPAGTDGSRRVVAVAEGTKASGAPQLFMAEPNPPDEIPGEHADFGAIVDMNRVVPGAISTTSPPR